MAMCCTAPLTSTTSICKCCCENVDGAASCCTGGAPNGDGITIPNCSHSGGGPNSEIATFQMFSQGGIFDNVQISSTLRCAYLLANPGKHVPLGGVFDKARIFIHIQIWLSFRKASTAHEVKIASTSVHGSGGVRRQMA